MFYIVIRILSGGHLQGKSREHQLANPHVTPRVTPRASLQGSPRGRTAPRTRRAEAAAQRVAAPV